LTEVTDHLDVHKSTALRLLQTLEREEAVRRDSLGKYVLGFGIIPLAEKAINQIDVRSIAHPHLEKLAGSIGHTVHLAQIIDGRVIYVDKIDGLGTVTMGSRIGLPADIHTSSVSKIILAFLPEAQRTRMLENHAFSRYTPTTISSEPDYFRELVATRKRGWAEDDGEKEDYINCIGFPVFDAAGRVTLGVSITALRASAGLEDLRLLIPTISEAATAVSRGLGWKGRLDVGL